MSNIIGNKKGNVIIPYASATKRTKWIDFSSLVSFTDDGGALSGASVKRALVQFYADSNNVWYMSAQVSFTCSAVSRSYVIIDFPNVVFKSGTDIIQVGSMYVRDAGNPIKSIGTLIAEGGNDFIVYHDTASTTKYGCRFDVELNAEPTTYTTSTNMESVVRSDIYIPPASATVTGLVDTGAQSFGGVKTFNDGIKLPTTGGTPSILNYYEEGSFTVYCADGTNKSSGQTAYYIRSGKMVTLYIPEINVQSVNTARYLTTTDSATVFTWPANLTPARNQYINGNILINTTYVAALITILTTGTFRFYSNLGGTAFNTNNEIKGVSLQTISYLLS